jgi:hypothetical protein
VVIAVSPAVLGVGGGNGGARAEIGGSCG